MTNDKQVNFSALNDSQQESRIKDLIKLEPKITLNQDKLELLSETDIFLKRSSIDSDFLRQLKPIIQKYCDDKDPDEDDIDIPAPLDEKKYIILGSPGAWTEKGIV